MQFHNFIATKRRLQTAVPPKIIMYSIYFCILITIIVTNIHGLEGAVPKKKLNNGLVIPVPGIGTWMGLNSSAETLDSIRPSGNETQQAMERAIAAGYRLIDTALAYYNEDQVGRAINNKIAEGVIRREDVYVISKLWNTFHKKDEVIKGFTLSLTNLGLDYLDLYLMHFPIALNQNNEMTSTDYLETWEAMIDLQKNGLIRSIGVSNFNQQQLERLISKSGVVPAVLQNEVNLNQQPLELISFCRRYDIVVIGYTPFGSLFYEKAKPDAPPPRVDDPTLVSIAKKHKKTVPQVNLNYLMDLGVIPIPKSINQSHIQENIDVFDFCLTKEDRCSLKKFNNHYRTLDISLWKESPNYPYTNDIV